MFKHMNACPLKPNKFKIRQDPRYKIQEKFKGIRAFLFVTPTGSFLQTRGGFFVEQNFKHLAGITGSYVLDGELFQRGTEDETVAGWANSKYLADDTSQVTFECFDIVKFREEDLTEGPTLAERDVFRRIAVEAINHPSVRFVPYLSVDPEEAFAEIVSQGGEGIMYKNLDSEYMQRDGDNRPANHWYKQKGVETYDVVVTGYTEGKGKFKGMVGAIEYGMYVRGEIKPLGRCSGMTDSMRDSVTAWRDTYLDTVMEVLAAGQDPKSGALIEPRFIRWRTDKRPEECVL